MKDSAASEPPLAKVAVWYAFAWIAEAHGLGGGISGIATNFVLKDRFGLDAEAMARYGTILAVPAYAGFLFGYARDRWSPRLGGDRNLIMLAIAVGAAALALLASVETTYSRLVAAMLALNVAGWVAGAGENGAIVRFAARRGITDRFSGFSLAMSNVISAVVAKTAGWGANRFAYRALLGSSAALLLVYVAFLRFAPRGVFQPFEPAEKTEAPAPLAARFAGLVRSRPYLAALGLVAAYNFGPAGGSAFFNFATDRLKVGPELWGTYNAVFNLATLAVALLYIAFARRTHLRNRMAVAVLLFTLQPALYFAFRTQADFVPVGALFGASNAIFLAAVVDLLLGAIPKGSEGLGFAAYGTCSTLVAQGSNLIGARIYDAHGLAPCVWLTFPVAALGFPLLALVPKDGVAPSAEKT